MWDISKALKIAKQKLVTTHLLIIDIFCNFQTAMNKLKNMGNKKY